MKFVHVHNDDCRSDQGHCLVMEILARGLVKDKDHLYAKVDYVFGRVKHYSEEQIRNYNMDSAERQSYQLERFGIQPTRLPTDGPMAKLANLELKKKLDERRLAMAEARHSGNYMSEFRKLQKEKEKIQQEQLKEYKRLKTESGKKESELNNLHERDIKARRNGGSLLSRVIHARRTAFVREKKVNDPEARNDIHQNVELTDAEMAKDRKRRSEMKEEEAVAMKRKKDERLIKEYEEIMKQAEKIQSEGAGEQSTSQEEKGVAITMDMLDSMNYNKLNTMVKACQEKMETSHDPKEVTMAKLDEMSLEEVHKMMEAYQAKATSSSNATYTAIGSEPMDKCITLE